MCVYSQIVLTYNSTGLSHLHHFVLTSHRLDNGQVLKTEQGLVKQLNCMMRCWTHAHVAVHDQHPGPAVRES